jgi:hypothetical protein
MSLFLLGARVSGPVELQSSQNASSPLRSPCSITATARRVPVTMTAKVVREANLIKWRSSTVDDLGH